MLRKFFPWIRSTKVALSAVDGEGLDVKQEVAWKREFFGITELRLRIVNSGLNLATMNTEEVFAAVFLVSEQRRRAMDCGHGAFETFVKNYIQAELLLRPGVRVRPVPGMCIRGDGWEFSYDIWTTHIVSKALDNLAWFLDFRNVEELRTWLRYLEQTR